MSVNVKNPGTDQSRWTAPSLSVPRNSRRKALTLAVLASTVFVSTVSTIASAAPLSINGSDAACAGTCVTEGVDFVTDNKLTVAGGVGIGSTGGVSVTASGGNNIGEILFTGAVFSEVLGKVTNTGNILRLITIDFPVLVDFSDDVRVSTLNFIGNGIAIFADGADLTATVTNDTSGQGRLEFVGTHTVTGDIGSTGAGVFFGLFGAGAGKVVTTTGNIKATVAFGTGSDADLKIADGKSITGIVSTTTDGKGVLTFTGSSTSGGDIGSFGLQLNKVNMNGGTFTLQNDIYAGTTTIASGATLDIIGNQTISPDLVNNGIINVGTADVGAKQLSVVDYTGGAGSTLNMLVTDGGASFSTVQSAGNIVIPTDGLDLVITGNTIPDGTVLNNVLAAGSVTVLPITIPDTLFYTFTTASTGLDLDVTVNTTAMSSFTAATPALTPIANYFDTLGLTIQTTAPALVPLYDQLLAQPDSDSLVAALGTLVPNGINNQTPLASPSVSQAVQTSINRISHPRHYQKNYYAAGDAEDCYQRHCHQYGTWVQGFDSNLRQGERDMVAGYDGDGRGLAIGFDREFDKHLTAGFAYAYSTASVDASDIAQSNLEISSNQGLVYGRYRKCDIYYMGVLSFANNLYNQQRHILIPAGGPDPAITATATSHFTGWQFNSYFETGIAINNICGFDYFCMVPHAILTYGHLRTHSYKELIDDGMGPNNVLGLTVQNEPQDDAKIGLGIKISHSYCSSKWRYTPYLRFAAMQSIISDAQESFANFNGVFGTGFISTGLGPARSSYLTGVGVEFDMGNNSYITLEYDYEAKTGFQMNSGFIKYRFQWC